MLLRQIAISSLTAAAFTGTIVLHVAQAALAEQPVPKITIVCQKQSNGKWFCQNFDPAGNPSGKPYWSDVDPTKTKAVKTAVQTCTIDASGGYNCTDSGTSLPPGTTINPRVTIVPRSERDPKLPTVDTRRALLLDTELKPCRTNNPRKEGRCIIKTLAPVAVQDPSTSDGKNEPVYPGLPPAPRNTIVSQVADEVKPDPDKCPVVLIDENNKPFCA